jgi:hypothetical protein
VSAPLLPPLRDLAPATEPPHVVHASGVSVILRAHNDRQRVGAVVRDLLETLLRAGYPAEVVVVDDASTDQTAAVARDAGANVVQLPARLGYAAAVRAGVEAAHHEVIALFDPDGGFQSADLVRLLTRVHDHAMVVGTRPAGAERGPIGRRIARGLLRRVAQFLADREIPDLNSGLRVFRRAAFRRFAPLGRGFALTTVLTLGMLGEGLPVAWVPVTPGAPAALGSAVRPFTGPFELLHLLVRVTLLFNPLKALAPPGYALLAAGGALAGVDLARAGDTGGLAILLAALGAVVLATAFLADLLVTLHRART